MPYPSLETFEVANNNNSLISLFMCSSNSMLGKEIVQQCSSCSVSQRCSAPYSRSLEVGHLSAYNDFFLSCVRRCRVFFSVLVSVRVGVVPTSNVQWPMRCPPTRRGL